MKKFFSHRDITYFENLVLKAGKKASAIQQKGITVTRKRDFSVVTEADVQVQDMLIRAISRRFRTINFIYEEGFQDSTHDPVNDDTVSVIIDPIDGTSMFSMYMPIWCVSVGVFLGNKPLYGFVYAPGMNLFFHNDDEAAYINRRQVRINGDIHIDPETNIFYATEIHKKIDISFPGKGRNLGSTALHACLTIDNARNRTLAFIGKSYLWDWAGAVPIIIKAGGNVRYLDDNSFNISNIVKNNCILPDFCVAYTCRDFATIKKIFTRI